jgi:WhiB family transcriptional regulator, redox-sensing transcriptional regulator
VTADWRMFAACLDEDPELFFPIGSTGRDYDAQVEEAKTVCRGCPVRTECLDWADHIRAEGIWGGLTDNERAAVRRRHNRQQARACDNCGHAYQPGSTNDRYCRPCAPVVHQQQKSRSAQARRVA